VFAGTVLADRRNLLVSPTGNARLAEIAVHLDFHGLAA
jgi:hypothetical protein